MSHSAFDLQCWGTSELIEYVVELEAQLDGREEAMRAASIEELAAEQAYSDEVYAKLAAGDYTMQDVAPGSEA